MAILIKRYANRKLYNTKTSRYITLKGVAELLDDGEEVRVIDNETGEDITQVALSQILVDNKRAKEDPSDTLLSQILSRGGDALYGAIRKSVDDASDGIGDFQERFKHFVQQADSITSAGRGFGWDRRGSSDASQADFDEAEDRYTDPIETSGDLVKLVRSAVSDAFGSSEFPTRREIERLNRNLERVAVALESLDSAPRARD